jgi:hypothetical protein
MDHRTFHNLFGDVRSAVHARLGAKNPDLRSVRYLGRVFLKRPGFTPAQVEVIQGYLDGYGLELRACYEKGFWHPTYLPQWKDAPRHPTDPSRAWGGVDLRGTHVVVRLVLCRLDEEGEWQRKGCPSLYVPESAA